MGCVVSACSGPDRHDGSAHVCGFAARTIASNRGEGAVADSEDSISQTSQTSEGRCLPCDCTSDNRKRKHASRPRMKQKQKEKGKGKGKEKDKEQDSDVDSGEESVSDDEQSDDKLLSPKTFSEKLKNRMKAQTLLHQQKQQKSQKQQKAQRQEKQQAFEMVTDQSITENVSLDARDDRMSMTQSQTQSQEHSETVSTLMNNGMKMDIIEYEPSHSDYNGYNSDNAIRQASIEYGDSKIEAIEESFDFEQRPNTQNIEKIDNIENTQYSIKFIETKKEETEKIDNETKSDKSDKSENDTNNNNNNGSLRSMAKKRFRSFSEPSILQSKRATFMEKEEICLKHYHNANDVNFGEKWQKMKFEIIDKILENISIIFNESNGISQSRYNYKLLNETINVIISPILKDFSQKESDFSRFMNQEITSQFIISLFGLCQCSQCNNNKSSNGHNLLLKKESRMGQRRVSDASTIYTKEHSMTHREFGFFRFLVSRARNNSNNSNNNNNNNNKTSTNPKRCENDKELINGLTKDEIETFRAKAAELSFKQCSNIDVSKIESISMNEENINNDVANREYITEIEEKNDSKIHEILNDDFSEFENDNNDNDNGNNNRNKMKSRMEKKKNKNDKKSTFGLTRSRFNHKINEDMPMELPHSDNSQLITENMPQIDESFI